MCCFELTPRPQYAKFPTDEGGFAVDDQYYIGDSGVLFKPVVTEGATETSVYLAANEPYYDYFHRTWWSPSPTPRNVTIATPLDAFPLLLEGGHIVSTRERVRRTSSLMSQDPFTLTLALGRDGAAAGQLYMDDGESYAFESGAYVHRAFAYTPSPSANGLGTLASRQFTPHDAANAYAKSVAHVHVERIVILGAATKPAAVTVAGKAVDFAYAEQAEGPNPVPGVITIKNPGVRVADDWEVVVA
jgi:alpha 1,3-glucosidase